MALRLWTILTLAFLTQLSTQDVVELKPTSVTAVSPPSRKLNEDNIANAVNNFGYKLLLKMMNESREGNVVLSPTSVTGLLAMALLGSVGRTFEELTEALGFSQDLYYNRREHEEFGRLLLSLNANVSTRTLYANAVFVDAQTSIRELYRNYLLDVYRADIRPIDFKQTQFAKDMINKWFQNHTEGKIEDFLKHTLPMTTKMVLLSALYFNAQWKQPFRPEYTAKMPFKTVNDEIMAELMLNAGEFPFINSNEHEFIMIGLPYNDSETFMYALKPRSPKKKSLSELMNELNYNKIDRAINAMTSKNCVVRFPKMKLENRVNLENTLKSMGIHEMFTPQAANFALAVDERPANGESLTTRIQTKSGGISREIKNLFDNVPNPGLYVDAIMHNVKININEYGTEAVAATSAILARTAEQFYANSPFYMFIRNNRTKLVTFNAVIYNPMI